MISDDMKKVAKEMETAIAVKTPAERLELMHTVVHALYENPWEALLAFTVLAPHVMAACPPDKLAIFGNHAKMKVEVKRMFKESEDERGKSLDKWLEDDEHDKLSPEQLAMVQAMGKSIQTH